MGKREINGGEHKSNGSQIRKDRKIRTRLTGVEKRGRKGGSGYKIKGGEKERGRRREVEGERQKERGGRGEREKGGGTHNIIINRPELVEV